MIKPEPDYTNPSAFPEIRTKYQRADPYSERRIIEENWSEHAAFRREAWRAWSRIAVEHDLQPIWKEPHPESCPWVIPVYASSQKVRISLLRSGRRNGLNFFPWPSLPKSVLKSSTAAVARWQSLLCFPLNQKPNKAFMCFPQSFKAIK